LVVKSPIASIPKLMVPKLPGKSVLKLRCQVRLSKDRKERKFIS